MRLFALKNINGLHLEQGYLSVSCLGKDGTVRFQEQCLSSVDLMSGQRKSMKSFRSTSI